MNPSNLRPGDLLLFRVSGSSNWLDKLIGWGQKVIHQAPTDAAYCHVAVVGPDASHYYEATWPRITNTELQLEKIQKNIILEAYRVAEATPAQIQQVMDYAQNSVGRRYDWLAILTFGKLQFGTAAVCSQFAWQAFTYADICLCPWQDLESPDDIAASRKLVPVP